MDGARSLWCWKKWENHVWGINQTLLKRDTSVNKNTLQRKQLQERADGAELSATSDQKNEVKRVRRDVYLSSSDLNTLNSLQSHSEQFQHHMIHCVWFRAIFIKYNTIWLRAIVLWYDSEPFWYMILIHFDVIWLRAILIYDMIQNQFDMILSHFDKIWFIANLLWQFRVASI